MSCELPLPHLESNHSLVHHCQSREQARPTCVAARPGPMDNSCLWVKQECLKYWQIENNLNNCRFVVFLTHVIYSRLAVALFGAHVICRQSRAKSEVSNGFISFGILRRLGGPADGLKGKVWAGKVCRRTFMTKHHKPFC